MLRIGAFLGLVAAAAYFADLESLWDDLSAISPTALAVALGLQTLAIVLMSWRFWYLVQAAGAQMRLGTAHRLTFAAALANMVLPTSLGGDAGRIVLTRRLETGLNGAIAVGVLDRMVGLVALCLTALLGAIFVPHLLPPVVVLLVAMPLMVLAVVVFWRTRLAKGRVTGPVLLGLLQPKVILLALAVSLLGHALSAVIAHTLLAGQTPMPTLAQTFVLFPAVLLAASLPISIGGWGTREVAAIAAFALVGVEASGAVAMTLVFGITQLVAAALGTALCLSLWPARAAP